MREQVLRHNYVRNRWVDEVIRRKLRAFAAPVLYEYYRQDAGEQSDAVNDEAFPVSEGREIAINRL